MALAASLVPLAARAQSSSGDLPAYRIPSEGLRPRIDGLLGDEVWSQATPVGGFRQREPREGAPATERTEVRVAYDEENLYVAVMAYDSEPERVVARILQRDKLMEPDFFGGGIRFAGDDAVAILLDSYDDHRNAVIFATNPNGAEFEALLTDEGSEINIDWRGVWEVAGTRTADGWSAEFALPWRTLRYPSAVPPDGWGLNVYRIIRRKNEDTLWQAWQREGGGFHRVSRAGHLTGLEDLPRPGLNLEAKPYVLAGRRQELDHQGVLDAATDGNLGLDLKMELRPGLLLDLTYNTDFAQVEVDDAQVNLTRFDLFFPEKRDFFLENAGIFQFGVPGNPFEPPAFQLFFSRRIGIEEDEGEVPILGGARLTGRVGGQTVGLLNLVTDEAYGLPRENFSVARVKRDLGEANYLGLMVVDRRGGGAWNTAAGVDGQFTFGGAWVVDAYYARTYTGGARGDQSFRVGLDYTGEVWGAFGNHVSIGPDAEAEGGFITRNDVRRTDLFGRRRWRPARAGLRKIDMWFGGNHVTTWDGRMQDWAAGGAFNPEWESGETFNVFVNAAETILDESFELTDSIVVEPGRYRNDHILFFGNTAKGRWISLDANGMFSRFYGGTLKSLGGTVSLAPTPQVALGLGFTRNDVDVPNGSFVADISSVRASYSFSRRLTTNLLLQYNSLDRAFSTNLRLNFIHRPGSDLFIVLTEDRGDERRVWNLQDRGLVVKITYLARM